MDKVLAGRLNLLFGEEEKFKIFLEYLQTEESLLMPIIRNSQFDNEIKQTQGKLQHIEKLRGLRETIRAELKGN